MGVHCEGVEGATADFVCFHALWKLHNRPFS